MAVNIKAKNISNADKRLVELMRFGLNHGIENIRIKGKGPIAPFLVMEMNGEREVLKLFTEDPDAGLGEGIRMIRTDQKSRFVVIVYDGYLPAGEKMMNAIIAKGYDRNDVVGYAYAQRYLPKKFLSWFRLLGDRAYLGNTEQLLSKTSVSPN
jgi:hypothetical protein